MCWEEILVIRTTLAQFTCLICVPGQMECKLTLWRDSILMLWLATSISHCAICIHLCAPINIWWCNCLEKDQLLSKKLSNEPCPKAPLFKQDDVGHSVWRKCQEAEEFPTLNFYNSSLAFCHRDIVQDLLSVWNKASRCSSFWLGMNNLPASFSFMTSQTKFHWFPSF